MIYRTLDLKPIIDVIVKHESNGDPDIIWGGISRRHHPSKPLTSMTIGQVLDWQDSIDPLYRSEAAGKFQILEDTLREYYRSAGLNLSDRFSEENQDKIGVALMRRRRLDQWIDGKITDEKFANQLAKEWASLPVVTGAARGRSYYAGDGLNKALTSPEIVLGALKKIKETPSPQKWGWLLNILKLIFKR